MNIFAKIREYLLASRKELEAVHWPTRQETIRYSALVIGVSVVFAVFFGALDLGLNTLVNTYVSGQPAPTASTTEQPTLQDTSPVQVDAITDTGAPVDIKITPGTTTTP